MRRVLLQRRLLKLLDRRYEKHGETPTQDEFISFVINKRWLRFKGILERKSHFKRRITNVFGDCIEGVRDYVGYVDVVRSRLKVAPEGRDFIGTSRLELFYKHNARTTAMFKSLFVAFIASSGFWAILFLIYNFFAVRYHWPRISFSSQTVQ